MTEWRNILTYQEHLAEIFAHQSVLNVFSLRD
jgi:hypothetical protein